jgi:type 1 glutamine amidotransferase
MRPFLRTAALLLLAFMALPVAEGQKPSFRVLAFWTTAGEVDHSDFARQAIQFFTDTAVRDHFAFRATTDWNEMNPATLARTQVVVWLNGQPATDAQRAAFEDFINHGGAWLGTHVSGYNDHSTKWQWFVDFLGGAVFFANNWPALPATLHVDDSAHPVTRNLPGTFVAPANEWYVWKPSARRNPAVKVLITLAPSSYPLGFKDRLLSGDCPVVWTNTKYKMLYVNMGHGDKVMSTSEMRTIFENALMWLSKPAN